MAKVIAGMTMSLDGFINDSEGKVQLSPDLAELLETRTFQELTKNTGAVIMGRRVYEMADPFQWANDDYEFQVPIFVLTHTPPTKYPQGNGKLRFTFVTDGIESAIAQARHAAGEKIVQIIGGANTIQQSLNAGMCDELLICIMPILIGRGLPLFENIDTDKIKLERVLTEETTGRRTTIVFKVTNTEGRAQSAQGTP